MSADIEGSVQQVHQAFHDVGYWQGRLAETPVDVASLERMRIGGESGDDGTIEVITHQTMLSHHLPALVTQLHRGDLCVRREETWGPINDDGVATASITGAIVGAPVHLWGTMALQPHGGPDASRITVQLTIQVRVPFLGGKLERMIGNELGELVAIEQRFTTLWISGDS